MSGDFMALVEDSILKLCIKLSSSIDKEKPNARYMQDNGVINDKEGFWVPAVLEVVSATEPTYDERLITV